jgi:protein-tyrosine phosphatase
LTQLVDIHAHVLPEIDDGPKSLEESVAMVRAAYEAGIVRLVATPHLRSDFPAVQPAALAEALQAVQDATAGEPAPELVIGGEVSLSWALEAEPDALRLASFAQRGKDLLIETPASAHRLADLLYPLRARGYRVTLAHPERTAEFQEKPARLVELTEQGILLQVNAESLLGERESSDVRRTARWLCSEGIAHALASDAHRGHSWRPIGRLALAGDALVALVGAERGAWMTNAVPNAIIDGEPLPAPPPVAGQSGGLLARWRGRRARAR